MNFLQSILLDRAKAELKRQGLGAVEDKLVDRFPRIVLSIQRDLGITGVILHSDEHIIRAQRSVIFEIYKIIFGKMVGKIMAKGEQVDLIHLANTKFPVATTPTIQEIISSIFKAMADKHF